MEVNSGDKAELPCTYSGTSSQDVVVDWHIEKDGQRTRVAYRKTSGEQMTDTGTPLSGRVTIGEDFTLKISSVKPSDQLSFYCQVTAGKDGTKDGETKLHVFVAPEKPEIKKPSQAITVGEQRPSEIGTCIAKNGLPTPRIVWFKDNQPLADIKDIGQSTHMVLSTVKEASGLYTVKSILNMVPTKADKDSVFHCTVEYSLAGEQNKNKQMKSEPMKIELHYPSEKLMFDLFNATTVKEGDTLTLKCETDGNPQPTFDYYKDGKQLKTQDRDGFLILKNVRRTDSGTYKCSTLDLQTFEELEAEKVLNVDFIDEMNVTPKEHQFVMLGSKVEWQCKTKASKAHTVQWKKGSKVLSQDGTLSIESVAYADVGEYVCVGAVPDIPGLTAQASVNLTVKGPPAIETPAIAEVAKEGDEVTLRCLAHGFPTPQFTWTPSGKESVSLENNKVVSTVTLKATPEIMKSGVICKVSNENGEDTKTLSVIHKRANTAEGRAFSLLLLSSLLLSGLFVVQTL